jgi:group I intron endonuclease
VIVYKIENRVTGKCYVGQTTQRLRKRFQQHLSDARTRAGCTALAGAIRKYGSENFAVELLQRCASEKELNEAERFWIERLNCYAPDGYNIREGGSRGRMAESTKEKMRRRAFSPEHRSKISAACKGRKGNSGSFTPERQRGEGTKSHKLTWEKVREIRRRVAGGEKQTALAVEFGTSQGNVSKIFRNVQWVE